MIHLKRLFVGFLFLGVPFSFLTYALFHPMIFVWIFGLMLAACVIQLMYEIGEDFL